MNKTELKKIRQRLQEERALLVDKLAGNDLSIEVIAEVTSPSFTTPV